jgi:lipoprotein-anchoring transpeptidase ErfK/SrfK
MPSCRPLAPLLLVLLACSACDGTGSEVAQSGTISSSDSAEIAANAVRQAAAADSAAEEMRQLRLVRLRALEPTVDDLAARDSLDIRVEVDIAARRVVVLDAFADTLAQHAVAVGSKEWPTRTGEWTISQVVLNPTWIPPTDESWAEDADSVSPGDPANPLGRAQLVYDLPRSLHGTNEPSSIGKAVSHGSIRLTNDAVLTLAELLLRRTGIERAPELLQEARRDRSTKRVIDLPQLVPIRVFDGATRDTSNGPKRTP